MEMGGIFFKNLELNLPPLQLGSGEQAYHKFLFKRLGYHVLPPRILFFFSLILKNFPLLVCSEFQLKTTRVFSSWFLIKKMRAVLASLFFFNIILSVETFSFTKYKIIPLTWLVTSSSVKKSRSKTLRLITLRLHREVIPFALGLINPKMICGSNLLFFHVFDFRL